MTLEEKAQAIFEEPVDHELDLRSADTVMSLRVLNSMPVLLLVHLLVAAGMLLPVTVLALVLFSPIWALIPAGLSVVLTFLPVVNKCVRKFYGSAWGETITTHRSGALGLRAEQAAATLSAGRSTMRGRREARLLLRQVRVLIRQGTHTLVTYGQLGFKRTDCDKVVAGTLEGVAPERLAAGRKVMMQVNDLYLEMCRIIAAMETLSEIEAAEAEARLERQVLEGLQTVSEATTSDRDRLRTRTLMEQVESRQENLAATQSANEELRRSLT